MTQAEVFGARQLNRSCAQTKMIKCAVPLLPGAGRSRSQRRCVWYGGEIGQGRPAGE
jgi:hypothetical protein